MESKLLTQKEILQAGEKLLKCLQKLDTQQEKVSQTLFNVYPDEMHAIAKLIAKETGCVHPYENVMQGGTKIHCCKCGTDLK